MDFEEGKVIKAEVGRQRIRSLLAVGAICPQRLPRSVIPGLLVLAILCVGAVAYLASFVPKFGQFWPTAWNASDRLPAEDPAKPHVLPLPADALANLPPDLRAEITASSMTTYVEFGRRFNRPIDRMCEYLDSLDLGEFTTMHNPVADSQWVCSSDVIPANRSALMSDTSSIFVWMRGSPRGEVDLVRLKVNLTHAGTSEAAKTLTLTLLDKLFGWFSWDVPEALRDSIRNVGDASFSRNGISYEVRRELSSISRLNIVIRPDDRSGIIPSYDFKRGGLTTPPLSPTKFRGMLRYEIKR